MYLNFDKIKMLTTCAFSKRVFERVAKSCVESVTFFKEPLRFLELHFFSVIDSAYFSGIEMILFYGKKAFV
jgi:hypothetical protein